ncbi:MAG: DUF1957 domain-containing protein, partial [Gemmatimonadaceae bacterium]|nr:DUF1957 domain-containing protein [Gemmatimonadaceae bacterium]
ALGSFAMWLNERTAWLWRRLWPLELRFWAVARTAIAHAPRHAVLVQAARALLLAQSSDWPFMLTRDEAADHAARRATAHLDACEALVTALEALADDAAPDERLVAARALAAEQARLDDPFHDDDVLAALQGALAAGPTPGGASRRTSLAVAPVVADATGDGGAAAVAA